MQKAFLNQTKCLRYLILFWIVLLVGCETTQKVTTENPFGKVTAMRIAESTDSKTGITKEVERVYVEVAAKSVSDEGSQTTDPSQVAVEVGEFFPVYDVNDTKGILLEIPNGHNQEGSDLWIYKNGKTRLTKTNYYHHNPSFSDDGTYVLFASKRGKNLITDYSEDSYIWRMKSNAAGGITRIGSSCFENLSPSYSPDQSKVLCDIVSLRGDETSIWYMESNGSLPSQLTEGESPRWLNDDTISFCAKDDISGLYGVWTCKIDGSMLTQLVEDSEFDCIQPDPHPHGKYIAFVKQKSYSSISFKRNSSRSGTATKNLKIAKMNQSRDIYVYDIESGITQQITTNASRDDMPKWSEDGSMLYFRSTRGLAWNVWRVPFRGFED